jgi:hypothetical protein
MSDMEAQFRAIEEMGFSRTEAQDALTSARGNLQVAVDWLLTNCPQGRTGVSESSPKTKQQAAKTGNGSREQNFVPPPPLDASDTENAQHLEALKRNHSNEIPKPNNASPLMPIQPQQVSKTETGPSGSPATPSNVSAPISASPEPVVLSIGTITQSIIVCVFQIPKFPNFILPSLFLVPNPTQSDTDL